MNFRIIYSPSIEDLRSALEYINTSICNGDLKYLGTDQPYDDAIIYNWFGNISKGVPHVVIMEDSECLGLAHIDLEHGRRSVNGYLAITVNPKYRNKKVGEKLLRAVEKEAYKKGLVRITAEPCTENKGAIKFLEANGYKIEGVLTKAFRTSEGKLVDRLVLGKILEYED